MTPEEAGVLFLVSNLKTFDEGICTTTFLFCGELWSFVVNCGHLWSFVVKFPSMRIPQMSGFNLVWLCTTRKKMVFDKNYHTLTFLSITFSENHDLLGILEDAILTCGLLWSFVVNCGHLW